jgi:DNA-binding MarR family transcriptional regulator
MELEEDPNSGREKLITLSPAGQHHCNEMIESACNVIKRIIENFLTTKIKWAFRCLCVWMTNFLKSGAETIFPCSYHRLG